MYTDSQNWILQNCEELSAVFGANNVYFDEDKFKFLQIINFHLPDSWSPNRSTLLIVLPLGSQIFRTPPDRFYLNIGLRNYNNEIPNHYFEDNSYNDLFHNGWARYSFHIQNGWHPNKICKNGTRLIDLLDALYTRMDDAIWETEQ